MVSNAVDISKLFHFRNLQDIFLVVLTQLSIRNEMPVKD